MKTLRKIIYIFLIISFTIYVVLKQRTYQIQENIINVETSIADLTNDINNEKIIATSEVSQIELEEKNPDLSYNNNVYYLEEEEVDEE